ncbi:MAG: sensor histidine kinase, partial [Candidatus Dormibacteraeota bacterium]|nr:sensor histidine kinase [Candidatus Dormibacteraeota bacterium]
IDAPGWWRYRRWPGRLFDVGVILALLLVGAVIVLTSTSEIPRLSITRLPLYVAVLVPLASLLARRRYPLVTIGVITGGVILAAAFQTPVEFEPLLMVATYVAASRFPWKTALGISAGMFILFIAATAIRGSLDPKTPVSLFVPMAGAYAVGVYVSMRVAYIDSLRARATQLERERELLAQQSVAEERVRIARELHDIVAHHLSIITVQAGALRAEVAPDSAPARTADVIARTGHQAMDEMRRMLGVLRLGGGEDTLGLAPQPGIAEIEQLVAQTRAAGVETTLRIDGERRMLPPAIEASAYRIVQEALTNVLRHAGPARCTVVLAFQSEFLEVSITDDGRGAAADNGEPTAPGHGLVGMRERVAMFGGDLFAGTVPGGGFAVRASLPFAAVPPR